MYTLEMNFLIFKHSINTVRIKPKSTWTIPQNSSNVLFSLQVSSISCQSIFTSSILLNSKFNSESSFDSPKPLNKYSATITQPRSQGASQAMCTLSVNPLIIPSLILSNKKGGIDSVLSFSTRAYRDSPIPFPFFSFPFFSFPFLSSLFITCPKIIATFQCMPLA